MGQDQNLAPAITQVTINRVNNLEKQEDTNLESASSRGQHESRPAIINKEEKDNKKSFKLLNIDTNEDVTNEEANTFKTAKDAEAYYRIFQKTMNNISQKKKT